MVKVQLEFHINDIRLGDILDPENPEYDVTQYLVIDLFKVNITKDGEVYIIPEKTHVKKYPIAYCGECLKQKKRNKEIYHIAAGKPWCKNHYAKVMREQDPSNACPKCADGYMKEAGIELEVRRCTHCGYEVPIPGRGVAVFTDFPGILVMKCEDCANGPPPCYGDLAYPACFVARAKKDVDVKRE